MLCRFSNFKSLGYTFVTYTGLRNVPYHVNLSFFLFLQVDGLLRSKSILKFVKLRGLGPQNVSGYLSALQTPNVTRGFRCAGNLNVLEL